MNDLFGQPITLQQAQERVSHRPKKSPYADMPGTGPVGETCKSCAHSYKTAYTSKAYWKCGLVNATRGPGTDIKARSPACSKWKEIA